ncbi:hypothetical protein AA0119_g7440 [Alternaria tenuissima]|uniref:Uncharacterized protein n=1 Tax=Alternaria tenuissima TaxID=119927 RepID=A0AB37VYN5_9PLEO|nr:hypothetical protein AA0115_g12321 [Alternaria tenuissima]RYN97409.1 hypothetical protein AA0119_g7440 [Alternaria tenuissima]
MIDGPTVGAGATSVMWMSMGLLDIVNLWSQQLEQVNKEYLLGALAMWCGMEDIAVSTAAFYPQELTVLPHCSLPEPKMLDHDLGRDPTSQWALPAHWRYREPRWRCTSSNSLKFLFVARFGSQPIVSSHSW